MSDRDKLLTYIAEATGSSKDDPGVQELADMPGIELPTRPANGPSPTVRAFFAGGKGAKTKRA